MEATAADEHMNRCGVRKEPRGILKHEENEEELTTERETVLLKPTVTVIQGGRVQSTRTEGGSLMRAGVLWWELVGSS